MANRDKELRRIWNKSDTEYQETFKGEDIVIPPHGSIVRGRRWVVDFLGSPTKFDSERPDDPKNIKHLTWEAASSDEPEQKQEFVCNMCGERFTSKQALGGHTTQNHGKAEPAPKPA